MHRILLCLICVVLLAGLGTAQFHKPVFITGGYGYTTSTYYKPGLFLLDGVNQTVTSLFPSWVRSSYIYDAMMDADNKRIVFLASTTTSTTYNLKSGIFRLDPSTGVIQTIAPANYPNNGFMYSQYRMMLNQEGEYMVSAYGRQQTPSKTRYRYHILKVDASSVVSSVFTSAQLGLGNYDRAYFSGVVGIDIDTGDYLVNTNYYSSSTLSKLGSYPWIRIDPHVAGKWTTFSGGTQQFGKSIYYTTTNQDFATGNIEEVYYGRLYSQAKGAVSHTTVYQFGYPGGWNFNYNGVRDLQSAPGKRWCTPGSIYKRGATPNSHYWYAPGYAVMEGAPPYTSVAVDCDPGNKETTRYGVNYYYPYTWTFYQSRNIQSLKGGTGKWQLRFSCPNYPLRKYVAVIGASGIRPGVTLASGRRIWINGDDLVGQSFKNQLKPFFDAGPGTLSSNGEAIGSVDVSLLPKLNGLTVWIAMMVLDPRAPDGIAFIPDTYVMKLP